MAAPTLRLLFALALSGVAACQSIAGIEDRHFEPAVTGSPECEKYCNLVMKGCTDAFAAYPDRTTCIKTCDALPSGEVSQDNSYECRTEQAQLAVNGGEQDSECPAAGPFGNGVCGTACEALCTLLDKNCADKQVGIGDCVAACGGIRADGVFDLSKLTSGDDVECRVAYASLAAVDPTQYCSAGALKSDRCKDPPKQQPSCHDMCLLATTECTGDNQVYNSLSDCEALCGYMDLGLNEDTDKNTVGCRKYHAYNAVAGPNPHCAHAGPGGGGHCDKSCTAYCQLMSRICPTEFGTFGDDATCRSACQELPDFDAENYMSASPTGDTLHCRFINLEHAAAGDGKACAAAIGGGECSVGDGGA
jgi:hypothetical protein